MPGAPLCSVARIQIAAGLFYRTMDLRAYTRPVSPLRLSVVHPRAASMAVLALLPMLGGCNVPAVLDPAGPVAAGEREILFDSLAIMLAIVIPTIVATLIFAWWFRAGNRRARYRPDWSYSGRLELLVWSVPLLVIIFLGGIGWVGSHDLDPPKPLAARAKPIEVDVVSLDWKWLFVYPEQGVASVNHLVIPAGVPVRFRITSATVMNSFFVPQLGSQIYAMSGMENQLNLMADKPGRFRGLSAHYSGEGFADMHFAVDAVPPAAFADWVANTRGSGPMLDEANYRRLGDVAGRVQPFTFRGVMPDFFHRAMLWSMSPPQPVSDGRERKPHAG